MCSPEIRRMSDVRNSLFLKIYVTLLGALAIVAVASAAFVRFGDDEMDRGWAARQQAFVAALLPAGDDPGDLDLVLSRLGRALDADITVYDAAGRKIAGVGRPVPLDAGDRRRHRPHAMDAFATRLPDGRVVAARLGRPPWPTDRRRNPLAYLVFIAAITGAAAYPVVRHLTRRLESLRGAMRLWGEGALAHRATVEGRDEVAAVAATFNQAAEHIERMIESNRALLANASHELRSPLARLRMAIDLYGTAAGDAARTEIVRNLSELDRLVEEILLASRLDHASGLERSEIVDLLALAAEEAARNQAKVSGDPASVRGDPQLLMRLVRNLLQNAGQHGVPPVVVEVRRSGGSVELSVRDHGPGIAQGEGERVFEPFYRPSGRGEAAGGWGLGLSLVRQIAAHHGATVHHEHPEGGGARFVVRFPPP
jgi:signal transduction histidine kinase